MSVTQIHEHLLERIHYIRLPKTLTSVDIAFLEGKIPMWIAQDVDMHVLDASGVNSAPAKFFAMIQELALKIQPKKVVTLNATDEFFREIVQRKLESAFNRVKLFPQDLEERKPIPPAQLRRLLIRYLIRAAYSAVEVTLNSTVSCDENYVAKAERVSYSQFDLISVIDVRNDFLKAQFRLCSSAAVLKKAATAMLGADAQIDKDTIESMAGELLNLIYGQAKSHLNDREGFNLPPAIPRVLRQDQFSQIDRSTSPEQLSILPLVTPLGSFYVEVDTGISA